MGPIINKDVFITRSFHIVTLTLQALVMVAALFGFFMKFEHRMTSVEVKIESVKESLMEHMRERP